MALYLQTAKSDSVAQRPSISFGKTRRLIPEEGCWEIESISEA